MTEITITQNKTQLSAKEFFAQDSVKNKFAEMLGKRAPQFITSVLQIAASNLPTNTEPLSIYNAAEIGRAHV